MNEINNLIQELCPDGVEYKELAKVLVIKNGKDYDYAIYDMIKIRECKNIELFS